MEKSFELITRNGLPGIKCLRCGHTSYNLNDIKEKYCGYCHQFHQTGSPLKVIDIQPHNVREVIGEAKMKQLIDILDELAIRGIELELTYSHLEAL